MCDSLLTSSQRDKTLCLYCNQQVFIKAGYVTLEGVVDRCANQSLLDYIANIAIVGVIKVWLHVCVLVLHSLRKQNVTKTKARWKNPNISYNIIIQSMKVWVHICFSVHCSVHKRFSASVKHFVLSLLFKGAAQMKLLLLILLLLTSQTLSPGGELLAGAGDEWWAHRASIPALLPVGLGTSCTGYHCPGYRLAWRLRMDNTQCVRTGARRCVSVALQDTHAQKGMEKKTWG